MALDLLLGLGLLASMASQLRISGADIGPGETWLAIWILLVVARETGRLGPPLTQVLSRLVVFWVVLVIALSVGTMTAVAIGDLHDPTWFQHDIFAYALVAATSCLTVLDPGAAARCQRVAWVLALVGAAWLALQVAAAWRLITLWDVDPWEWDRLRGASDSSNQLGFLCVVIGLISLHLADSSTRLAARLGALICLGIAIIVGRLTKSDAFALVLILSAFLFLTLKFRSWLLSLAPGLRLRTASAWLIVLATPMLLAYIVPLALSSPGWSSGLASEITRDPVNVTEEHARLRVELWKAAIARGIESRLLGLGPGPHLKIPQSILTDRQDSSADPMQVYHPQLGLAPNFEAHNTILDLFTQGGLLAVAMFIWLLGAALLVSVRAGRDGLITLVCGIALYSLFHLILRVPILWFAISFCFVMAAATDRRSRLRERIKDVPV